MRFQSLPGFRDFFPEEMAVRRAIEAAWHRASRAAGFQEWDGPPLEALELFTAKSGAEIAEQLYHFTDRGGREVALRPEMTPTLARVIGARAAALPKPIKWYCVPQFFRYERPQRGRLREFYQWNVDVMGAPEIAADAEAISVAVEALRALGLGAQDVVVRANDRRFVQAELARMDVAPDATAEVLALIDKLERDPRSPDLLRGQLGEARAQELLAWCREFPLARADAVRELVAACEDYGLAGFVEPDFKIVRGLAYYTGPVWEIFARSGELRAVAGGGRYDDLVAQLGGPALPALGFGMGDVVLAELLNDKGLLPPYQPSVDYFIIAVTEVERGVQKEVARRLRDAGHSVAYNFKAGSVGKQFKEADARGAKYTIVLGATEVAEGAAMVREMASGHEERMLLKDLG